MELYEAFWIKEIAKMDKTMKVLAVNASPRVKGNTSIGGTCRSTSFLSTPN